MSLRTLTKSPLEIRHDELNQLSDGIFCSDISAVYCGFLVSNISLEMPWDFFLLGGQPYLYALDELTENSLIVVELILHISQYIESVRLQYSHIYYMASELLLHFSYFICHFISGYWLFQCGVKTSKLLASIEATKDKAELKPTAAKTATIANLMKLGNVLIFNSTINNVALSLSTDSSNWFSLIVDRYDFSYPESMNSVSEGSSTSIHTNANTKANSSTSTDSNPNSNVDLNFNPLVLWSEFRSRSLACLFTDDKVGSLTSDIYGMQLIFWSLPLNSRPQQFRHLHREMAVLLGSMSHFSLGIHFSPALPLTRISTGHWLTESKLNLSVTIKTKDENQNKTVHKNSSHPVLTVQDVPTPIVPGVSVLICPNRTSRVLLFVIEGFDTMVSLARIVLQTRASSASRQIKRNMMKLILASAVPQLDISIRVHQPVIQISGGIPKVSKDIQISGETQMSEEADIGQMAFSGLTEELSIHCEYKPNLSTHFTAKISQARGFALSKTSVGPPQLVQFLCLAPDPEPSPKTSILCQPFPLVLPKSSQFRNLCLVNPPQRTEEETDDAILEVTLIEYTSKVGL